MKYSEKLRDPRWQRMRLEVMQRDKFACMSCNDKATTLNVHHKQYHGNPWDAPMEYLETLCEPCHHRRTKINNSFLSMSTKRAFKAFPHGISTDREFQIVSHWHDIQEFCRVNSPGTIIRNMTFAGLDDEIITVHCDEADYRAGKIINWAISEVVGMWLWVEIKESVF